MSLLNVEKLVKIYNYQTENAFEALHGVDFQVEKGDFICVMGPSGAGKSTFINCISTIDRPTFGTVTIDGTDVNTMSEEEIGTFRFAKLGFIFQDFNLLDTHTFYENIAMPLALSGMKKEDIPARVKELADRMDITHLLDKLPRQCSGGQRQRAAICRALVNRPGMIVADEPTGNLDSKNSHELMGVLRSLNEQDGVTIIMVTHDAMIASYSSKLIYIKDGLIQRTLVRGDNSQEDYFNRIVALNAEMSGEGLGE